MLYVGPTTKDGQYVMGYIEFTGPSRKTLMQQARDELKLKHASGTTHPRAITTKH